METLSFAFGVLSMIGLLFVITIVIGAVKVINQGKQIKELQDCLENTHRDLDLRTQEMYRDMNRRSEEFGRDISHNMDHLSRTIQTNYSESISYTDSRLDKLEQKLTGASSTKQIVKG